jgi:methylmalonyl-CoA mutase cobalamin-binding domain/chain
MKDIELGELLPPDLPSGKELVARGRQRARSIPTIRSRYTEIHDAPSDRAYKERCRDDGTITTYINLGYKTWAETADALNQLTTRGKKLGYRLDRVSLIPDRRMGLTPDLREQALEETGLMMYTEEDWLGATQDTEVSPIWNDHNVGCPAAIVNTSAAIAAGFGYIGNMAQHNYGYPLWDDDVQQMANTVEAIAMIAEKRDDGVVLESYIEDGFCAGYHDLATSLGWCIFHRYVAEELIGAAHSQSYGSTFADPVLKQAFGLALDAINVHRVPPSFTHGDTNSFGTGDDFDRNATAVFHDVFYTAAREVKHPTGGAIHATPVSEALRIPTIDELAQSLVIADEAIGKAKRDAELVDWVQIYEVRDRILDGGRRYFERLLGGLGDLGVDTRDPLQLLLATRLLGGSRMEELFGVGEPSLDYPRGFEPVVASDTLRRLLARRDATLGLLRDEGAPNLEGLRIVAASNDIHEYGLFVLSTVLRQLGAKVTDLGTSVSTREIAKVAVETDADVVAVSTYNGMALSLGKQLIEELQSRGVRAPLFMGGRLNEDIDGESAVDVRGRLGEVGVIACDSVEDMVRALKPVLSGT